jgi:hypothetical protein
MYNEFIYELEQEWLKYQTLINTKEILTQEEYEFCVEWDAAEAWKYLNNIGEGRWLNINVYSEHEHEEHQLRMEQGL